MKHFAINNQCHLSQGNLDERFTLKGTTEFYSPDHPFKSKHVVLDLNIDIKNQSVKGRCLTTLEAVSGGADPVVFNAVNFTVERVKWNDEKISFTHKNGKLSIKPKKILPAGDEAAVEIFYRIRNPKLGIYFLKPDRYYPKRPTQVWTQGQDEYARFWFPCHDTPGVRISTEMIATVPAGFTAVSNGKLVKTVQNKKDKTTTFHYKQNIPHAAYLVTLTVGQFSLIKDKWKNVPVQYFCEKGREMDAKRAFGKTPKMIEYFSKSIGVPYPYEKYAQVAVSDFIYGGMENTSATTQTDTALLDQRAILDYNSDGLVAHELAHQWFGDLMTCRDWSHAWLNESFATYFDALFKRHDCGEDEYLYAIRNNSLEYFSEDKNVYRRPLSTTLFKNPTDMFDRHLYEKGSVILYMLHHLLGEELFWKSINTYVQTNKGNPVETIDFIRAIEKATGRNMRAFFDQWVFSPGHPTYRVRTWWNQKKKEITLRIVQTNSGKAGVGVIKYSFDILFVTPKSKKKVKVDLDKKAHQFHFKLDAEPKMVLFDPDHRVLAQVDFQKTEDELIYQLNSDPNPIGRIEASEELSKLGSEQARTALRNALLKDSFWGVQVEAAFALGKMVSEKSADILLNCLDVVENPKVRRAVYSALKNYKSEKIAMAVIKSHKNEASYFAQANGLRTIGAQQHSNSDVVLKEALNTDSWNSIICISALEGLAATNKREHIPLFLKYTKLGQPHRVRMAAVRGLVQLGKGHPSVQPRLIELLQDGFLLVRIAAVRALHYVGDERAVPSLKKLTSGDLDGRLKRLAQDAVNNIMEGID